MLKTMQPSWFTKHSGCFLCDNPGCSWARSSRNSRGICMRRNQKKRKEKFRDLLERHVFSRRTWNPIRHWWIRRRNSIGVQDLSKGSLMAYRLWSIRSIRNFRSPERPIMLRTFQYSSQVHDPWIRGFSIQKRRIKNNVTWYRVGMITSRQNTTKITFDHIGK